MVVARRMLRAAVGRSHLGDANAADAVRDDVDEIFLEHNAGRGKLLVGHGLEKVLQHRFAVGDPLTHAGDAGPELHPDVAALEQQPPGPERILLRERAVAHEHGAGDEARKFRRPTERSHGIGIDQRVRDGLRCDAGRWDHTAEQVVGAADAEPCRSRARQGIARHEIRRNLPVGIGVVLASILEPREPREAPCDLGTRRGFMAVQRLRAVHRACDHRTRGDGERLSGDLDGMRSRAARTIEARDRHSKSPRTSESSDSQSDAQSSSAARTASSQASSSKVNAASARAFNAASSCSRSVLGRIVLFM
jgi:hypothetical protein